MSEYQTEEEQLDALKRWWEENGRSTLAVIIVGLAATFGWQSYQGLQERNAARASEIYQQMLGTIRAPEPENAEQGAALAQQLKSNYGGSGYAEFAALHLAAVAVKEGDLKRAQEELRWVLGEATSGSENARIAALRLARVLHADGESEQALAILRDTDPGSFEGSYAAVEGDILVATGRQQEAVEAYTRALAAGAAGGANMPVLQQKLQSLLSLSVAAEAAEQTAESTLHIPGAMQPDSVPPETTSATNADSEQE